MKRQAVSLKLNKEFKRAYFKGAFQTHPLLVSYAVKNRLPIARIGITTSKKVGGAVERNRARRVIRQAFYELEGEGKLSFTGYDFVFVARGATCTVKTPALKKVMERQLSILLSRGAKR